MTSDAKVPDLIDGDCVHGTRTYTDNGGSYVRCASDCDDCIRLALAAAKAEGRREMEERKDAAYLERNRVVAALARVFPSGVARTAIEGWSEDWHGCVYIDLPTGQVSWHFHDSQAYLFDGLPPYHGEWDGHDTDEKYRRVAALSRAGGEEGERG